jgi:ATP/maltotriose-dependent transcriptional regulator MalT
MRGGALTRLGRLAEGRALLTRAAELVSDTRAQGLALLIELIATLGLSESGFPEGSLERIAVLATRADEAETHNIRANARYQLARCHLLSGRPDEALVLIEEVLGILQQTGVQAGMHATLGILRAQARVAQGDVALARDEIEQLVTRTPPVPTTHQLCLVAHAEVLTASDPHGERARIESSLAQAAELAGRIGSLGMQASVHAVRAGFVRAAGDEAGWRRELSEALRIYTEMEATGWIDRISEELAS